MAAIERGEGTYSYIKMEYPVVPLRMEPIGRDALIFLINSANPVASVSSREIVDIYSGKITNWQEVGGRDSTILAFQRDRESGSQNLMRQLVMQGVPLKEAEESYMLGEMGELIEAVASYDYSADALGYSVYYYASNMKNEPNLRMLGIDGVIPSTETIRSGAYGQGCHGHPQSLEKAGRARMSQSDIRAFVRIFACRLRWVSVSS